jgi:AAA family ATPase
MPSDFLEGLLGRQADHPLSHAPPQHARKNEEVDRLVQIFTHDKTLFPQTILFFGPPGTGKSAAADDLARRCGMSLIVVRPSDLMSQWVGSSEKRIRQFFRAANAARPALLFFDEADALFSVRGSASESEVMRRLKTEALLLMQTTLDLPSGVVICAATNMPWSLDPAILRRLEHHVFVDLPAWNVRRSIVESRCSGCSREEVEAFVDTLSGCSCAEVLSACRRAKLEVSLNNHTTDTIGGVFVEAARKQHRACTSEDLDRMKRWSCSNGP